MNYSSQLSNLGLADRKAFYLLFAVPERPRHCPSLIAGGDRESTLSVASLQRRTKSTVWSRVS
jgi:hypothetical protein